ncbi:hypothetical protein Pmani_018816 [Petrolisthes manimaculis]|uniref:C2H2-type domain-containing protein n=2 Tax=Petrolisthes TaxID=84661 RepID=A0AAE1PJJ8_9EUCA|nr:hypothetical protein Pcinc_011846 [Petrolisthes cinctipes]KAK4309553.1 hypothetical protein Pmani_018816 [Petrolisthes manimaculis]
MVSSLKRKGKKASNQCKRESGEAGVKQEYGGLREVTLVAGTQLTVKVGRPRYAGPRDCPHCGKRYSTIAALKYHVGLVHSVTDQVPCFYCPQWFDIRTDLKKHLEVAHNEHS